MFWERNVAFNSSEECLPCGEDRLTLMSVFYLLSSLFEPCPLLILLQTTTRSPDFFGDRKLQEFLARFLSQPRNAIYIRDEAEKYLPSLPRQGQNGVA